MKLPSVRSIAIALAPIKTMATLDNKFMEVRIQLDEDGDWRLHTKPQESEDDHEGFWGHDIVDSKSDLQVVASNMLQEVMDHLYVHGYMDEMGAETKVGK